MPFWKKKKVEAPQSNETVEKDAIQLWYVSWYSRHNEFSSGTQKETEAFPSEKDALDFKKSLEKAFKLIKNTSENRVTLEERK